MPRVLCLSAHSGMCANVQRPVSMVWSDLTTRSWSWGLAETCRGGRQATRPCLTQNAPSRGECLLISTTQHLAKSSIHASVGTSQWEPSLWNEVGGPLPLTATFRSPCRQIPRVEWTEWETETDGKREASLCWKPLEDPPHSWRESHSMKLGLCAHIPHVHVHTDVPHAVSAYQTPPSKVTFHDCSERKDGPEFLAILCCENTGFAEPKGQVLPASVEGGHVHTWLEIAKVGTSS